MAWYAELKRRKWHCINGIDMISWYRQKLYDDWWDSLTEEQKEIIEARRQKEEYLKRRRAKEALSNLMLIHSLVMDKHSK